MKQLNEFASLAEAQAYTFKRMMSPDVMVKYLTMFDYADLVEFPSSKESKGLKLALGFGSEFNFMEGHPENIITMLDTMVANAEISVEFRDALVAWANVKPYSTTTQQEYDEANTLQKQASYPSESYIVTTAGQGVDVCIETDIDTKFYVYLSVCLDSQDQNLDESYSQKMKVGVVESVGGKAFLPLSHRKVRTYNRLYVEAVDPCTFSATVVTNRG